MTARADRQQALGRGLAALIPQRANPTGSIEIPIARIRPNPRQPRQRIGQDELETLARRHANFSFLTTLSRPESSWKGQTGRVTRLVDERIASVDNLAVYLCGNSGMIKDVSTIINRRGLCPIYREKYYDDAGQQEEY